MDSEIFEMLDSEWRLEYMLFRGYRLYYWRPSGFYSDTENEHIRHFGPFRMVVLFGCLSSYCWNNFVKIRWLGLYCSTITIAVPRSLPFHSHWYSQAAPCCCSYILVRASVVTGNYVFTIPTSNHLYRMFLLVYFGPENHCLSVGQFTSWHQYVAFTSKAFQ